MGRVPSNKVETVSNLCDASVPRREKLKQLIEKRIGKENFVEKLGFITKHELYSRAAQKPQPVFPSPEQMLFDHEFTKLVKELEGPSDTFVRTIIYSYHERRRRILIGLWQTVTTGMITKAVHKSSEEEKKEEEVKKTLEQHDNIVTQYKELIREQVNSLSCARCFFAVACGILSSLSTDDWFFRQRCRPTGHPGAAAEGAGVVPVLPERADAEHHHPAAVHHPAAQGPVQHPQAQTGWVDCRPLLSLLKICTGRDLLEVRGCHFREGQPDSGGRLARERPAVGGADATPRAGGGAPQAERTPSDAARGQRRTHQHHGEHPHDITLVFGMSRLPCPCKKN